MSVTLSSASNQTTAGNRIGADRIAVVTLAGATLSWNNTVNGFCRVGDTANGVNCVLAIQNAKFVWVEGNFSGSSATNRPLNVINLGQVSFSRFHQVRANWTNHASGGSHAISADNSNRNLFTDIQASPFSYSGAGMYMWGCSNNIYQNLRLSNGVIGIAIDDASSTKNVITGLLSVGNARGLSFVTNAANNTATHITSAFGPEMGLEVNGAGTGNTIMNFLSFNNMYGAKITWSSGARYRDFMLANNDQALYIDNANTSRFDGFLSVGSSNWGTDCTVSGTSQPLTASCIKSGSSTNTTNTGKTLASSFMGAVTTNEASNTSDTNGVATVGAAMDFFNFATPWRFWASNASSTITSNTLRSTVIESGASARIWDWTLAAADAVAKNRSGTGHTTANGTFTNGTACPAEVSGNNTYTGADGQVYLINAMEILRDDKGDDDGLCESNEACIYTPNIGAYQGTGDYTTMKCTFTNGTVTGVTMYAYPSN